MISPEKSQMDATIDVYPLGGVAKKYMIVRYTMNRRAEVETSNPA